LETIAVRAYNQSAAGIHICFQTLPPDVCHYGNSNGQRPAKPSHPMGALAGQAVPPAIHWETNI
jgi:hypothetical protein